MRSRSKRCAAIAHFTPDANATINQVTYGEVLLVKIIPREAEVDAPPLVVSDASWRSTLKPGTGWSASSFDASRWLKVQSLGVPGSTSDFLQWNADAGLYAWPGYVGASTAMRTFLLPVDGALQITEGSRIPHPQSLTEGGYFRVLPAPVGSGPAALTLDFGREINGRIHLVSASNSAVRVETSYGESPEEAFAHPYPV